MTQPAIQVDNISFSYGKIEAVKGISFDVKPGEILGFLGPNGAGKSTTIKMLTGQIVPKAGKIRILGMDMDTDPSEIQARIGVCFEEKNLYINMSALENLQFFASLFGKVKVDIDSLLSKVGLLDRSRDRVKSYSKGMRQRLMVARSLVNQPDVLFLDEPTAGLDPVSSKAVRNLIAQEAERGTAILLTTHDMHEADELSNRVAFINEGKLYALDTPENLKLSHGKRSVKVRLREDQNVREEEIEFDDHDAGEKLKAYVNSENLLTIHTEEATLENIFLQMTGRGLEG